MRCKHNDCNRRARTSGWCTTHYRRMRAGQDMEAPIRRYVQHSQENISKAASAGSARPNREKPFAAEYALEELGLRRRR